MFKNFNEARKWVTTHLGILRPKCPAFPYSPTSLYKGKWTNCTKDSQRWFVDFS